MESRAVIILGGAKAIPDLMEDDVVICADSGLLAAKGADVKVDHLVGDMDSLSEDDVALASCSGTQIHRYPVDKDRSDGEIALLLAIELGVKRIIITGGRSGRSDHVISTIHLPYLVKKDIYLELYLDYDRLLLLREGQSVTLSSKAGVVSVIPAGNDCKVSTTGLKWELHREVLFNGSTRGIHNEIIGDEFSVECLEGDLYLVLSEDE